MKALHPTAIGALLGVAAAAALAGVLYALAQLGLALFVPIEIAETIVYLTPGAIATEGIELLGHLAKIVLAIGGALILFAGGAAAGIWMARREAAPFAGLLVGAAGCLLVLAVMLLGRRPLDPALLGGTALALAAWGVLLAAMLRRALPVAPAPPTAAERGEPASRAASAPSAPAPSVDRRAFLRQGGVLLTVAVGSAAVGELLRRAQAGQAAQQAAAGPAPLPGAPLAAPRAVAAPPGAGVGPANDPSFAPGVGARPELTPTGDLYVVATTYNSPRVDAREWRLMISGMVDRPFSLSYDDLLALPRVDQTSTLTCISNEVGGDLIGNITWSGARLRDLIDRAGVRQGAIDVVLRSVEGYSDSIPLDRALNPQTLVVYGMNGTTLTQDHGFPARLIVPGIYGMKNVKWLNAIEIAGEDYLGYWEERGWSDSAIVKTQSTIDSANPDLEQPRQVALENGKVILGGYAFAGDRGISAVEVQIDGGAWQPAQLKQPVSALTWQPWRYEWAAAPGEHTISIRATDGAGQVQTSQLAEPHPDGASGWHTLKIVVTG